MSGDVLQLQIQDVSYGGRGVARHEGFVFFVEGVLPGELVLARVEKLHKAYGQARLVQVLEASPHRTNSDCPLCDATTGPGLRCGGCCYRHVHYEEEVRIKHDQLLSLLNRLGKINAPNCLPPIRSPGANGYRNKIVLHIERRDESVVVGYVAADNQTVLDVERCQLAVPELNILLTELRARAAELLGGAQKARLLLRYTPEGGAIWWVDGKDKPPTVVEKTLVGELEAPGNSFFQVNSLATDLLIGEVTELVRKIQPHQVVDLYCGVGVFGLAVCRAGVPSVWGFDHDQRAISAARKNAERHSMPPEFFHCARADVGLRKLAPSLDPQNALVIVDPPRTGLDRRTLEAITAVRPAHLVYVSCAADTLARDVAKLLPAGYWLVQARLIDMFPRTAHFEVVALLSTLKG